MMKQLGAIQNESKSDGAPCILLEMPLLSLLEFQENSLPISPDEMVNQLLLQLHNENE